MENWTFLTNHALVLSLIARYPNITAQEMAVAIGITERSIRSIIADLDRNRYISKKRAGRGLHYQIHGDLTLRHRTHREIAVGDFLRTLGWENSIEHSSLTRKNDYSQKIKIFHKSHV